MEPNIASRPHLVTWGATVTGAWTAIAPAYRAFVSEPETIVKALPLPVASATHTSDRAGCAPAIPPPSGHQADAPLPTWNGVAVPFIRATASAWLAA